MPIQVQFIDGVRVMTVESITQWMRSGGYTIAPNLANEALTAMLGKTKQYGFLQHAEFLRDLAMVEQFGRISSAGYPPNALSVVDAHLPQNVPDWIFARNSLPVRDNPSSMFTSDRKNFIYFGYTVAGWQVFVVWPYKYAKQPPKPNRLGWLPQMEFGASPGSTDPRGGAAQMQFRFRYTALNNDQVDLSFP
jgi:hypothetical protein